MDVMKISNVFLDSQIEFLNNIIKDQHSFYKNNENSLSVKISKDLGRIEINQGFVPLPITMYSKLRELTSDFFNVPHELANVVYVEYNKEYGTPNLPPHFDGDTTDLIINFQLSSNTSWGVGVGFDVYDLEDNSALLFNANEEIHWRPNKIFKEGEFVKMIFFRFKNLNLSSDYSHLRYSLDHEVYKDVVKFRDSLNK